MVNFCYLILNRVCLYFTKRDAKMLHSRPEIGLALSLYF